MSKLEKEVKNLRKTIFNMLNYANLYVLILDEKMEIKFANNSLAKDLGLKNYEDMVGKCWLDFLAEKDKKILTTIHKVIADGINWEKYKEFRNIIIGKHGKEINVHWFNSHINTQYNWAFSFGIKEPQPKVTMTSVRKYYKDIIDQDRTMINSMRDMIVFRENVKSCQHEFVEDENERSISV